MNKIIQLLLLFLLATACNSNSKNIGGYLFECPNYRECWVILDKGEPITLYDIQRGRVEKGVNLTYMQGVDSSFEVLGKGSVVISAYIDSFKEYDRYILISQKPIDSICDCAGSCKEKYTVREDSYEACKEAISKSKLLNFWIIDKKKDFIYGPLTKQAFEKHLIQLKGIK